LEIGEVVRKLRMVCVVSAGVVAVLATVGCGGGTNARSNRSGYTTGSAVAGVLSRQVSDTQGRHIQASCPDARLAKGETTTCHATFSNGTCHLFTVTVTGFGASGKPRIRVGAV